MAFATDGFRGTKRFVVEGRLGEGGMGVVHRVRDTERGEVLALKTVTRLDPGGLLRFKREFRALADITHPNIVQLYELFSEGDQWFFTMELVDGVDLLTWVRSSLSMPPPPPRPILRTTAVDGQRGRATEPGHPSGDDATVLAPTQYHETIPAGAGDSDRLGGAPAGPSAAEGLRPFAIRDVPRLRAAMRQLAEGLFAIHGAGKLHRDVKPSNVLVARDGRVVLLDFGVVGEYTPGRKPAGMDEPIIGTPAYMAPEQAAFKPATPASDWYSMGVILYQALTLRLPFDGRTTDILLGKQRTVPPPPSRLAEGVPEDLEALCVDLLRIEPQARPKAEEVLRRLESDRGPTTVTPSIELPFVGRGTELDGLRAAFEATFAGKPVTAMIHGPSGMGKSALAARFLGEVSAQNDAVVLSGRCYEREAVPFKAIDQVMDELARWLARVPEEQTCGILPLGMRQLARIFPVLENARVVADAGEDTEMDAAEPLEVRRRAFEALRELFAKMSARQRVVLHVDDLQWGDVDSVQLLEALLSPPSAPPILLIVTFRDELAGASTAVDALREAQARFAGDVRDVPVVQLSPREAIDLAKAQLEDRSLRVAEAIAAESHGNPLFVAELARWANGRRAAPGGEGVVSLEQAILGRVSELADEARALLETLSVAARPLEHGVAAAAAGIGAKLRPAAIALRGARLIAMNGLGEQDCAETAHDRIRETIAASLDDDARKERHLAIARALAASDRADPEAVFEHFRSGGDDEEARGYAVRAAEAADAALAFSRAARLYRAAIDLRAGDLALLHRRLGDALAAAGRVAQAADAYLAGAAHASAEDALDLRRMAAEYLLKSGRDDEGLRVLRTVLDAVGLRYPESTEAAIVSILYYEAKMRVLNVARRVRRATSVAPRDLARVDAAFTAANGLALTDILRGADFAARALALALDAGEPVRLCRALAIAAGNAAAGGEPSRKRAEHLVRAAEAVAQRAGDPHGLALALLASAFVHCFLGQWRSGRAELERCERIIRGKCRAASWELAQVQSWTCNVLLLIGELREAARRIPPMLEEAKAREDGYSLMHMIYPATCLYILQDDVETAWRVTQGVPQRAQWTAAHWGQLISTCSVDRYRGDARAAWKRVKDTAPALERSNLLRAALIRVCSHYERGLSAVAAAEAGFDREAALKCADAWSKKLAKEKLRYAPAMGLLVRACVAGVRGDLDTATIALRAATPQLDAADLGYLAASARHRLGQLLGGGEGRELIARSRAFYETQGITNVERCLAMSTPGLGPVG
jgi:eukaryotic-like serine/threonine-protein kinase